MSVATKWFSFSVADTMSGINNSPKWFFKSMITFIKNALRVWEIHKPCRSILTSMSDGICLWSFFLFSLLSCTSASDLRHSWSSIRHVFSCKHFILNFPGSWCTQFCNTKLFSIVSPPRWRLQFVKNIKTSSSHFTQINCSPCKWILFPSWQ